jgi:hypothetical protein
MGSGFEFLTLCGGRAVPDILKICSAFILTVSSPRGMAVKVKVLQSFRMLGATCSVTWHHIPEDLYL